MKVRCLCIAEFPYATYTQPPACLEDHCCDDKREQHVEDKALCQKCWLPICKHCKSHLSDGKLPPLSYANDMWTGYGLEQLYTQQVTAMELTCSSPCMACKCRSQPPIAGASLDRRALKSFAAATCQGRVESLICFCCGGTHPYVEEVAEKGDIQWYHPIQPRDDDGTLLFLGRPLQEIEQLIGLPTYLSRYNDLDTEGRKLTDHETFEDWHLKLPNLADGRLLCCPEAQIT